MNFLRVDKEPESNILIIRLKLIQLKNIYSPAD